MLHNNAVFNVVYLFATLLFLSSCMWAFSALTDVQHVHYLLLLRTCDIIVFDDACMFMSVYIVRNIRLDVNHHVQRCGNNKLLRLKLLLNYTPR